MTRGLYSVLLHLAMPFAVARLWWRGRREPGYRRHIGERFARYAEPAQADETRPLVWLHAVSVGEVRGAAPLVRALRAAFPQHAILVTCTTAAGRETALQVYGETVRIAYFPYDLPWVVARFLAHFRPRLALVMETEVWPNLLAACRARGVPAVLANARLSEKSARGYRRLGALAREAFAAFSAICAQDSASAERLRALGAGDVTITGSLKFDAEPDAAKLAEGRALTATLGARRVLLLASTRDGEEKLLLEALGTLPPDTLLVLVPRHPQRFDEVAALVAGRGLRLARRSRGETPGAGVALYLGDTMGEMALYYALADVAVIGGSFAPFGAQNLIEACAVGVPVVIGPSSYNFPEATRLACEAQAAVQVADPAAAAATARALLADAARRAAMGEAGVRLCAAHRGATARHLAVVRARLPATAPARD
ncbi:MAG TPA: lipid IV(A) 3-deoxy-D-manno-octulosonic acid transferase [Burkholderiales bacterium]|nr:lipid IV(A) 3-deoxy-D-manno-octulosonic acid transferase [Burkholderiales bacterium]